MRGLTKTICVFCGKDLGDDILPECDCDSYKEAYDTMIEEYRNSEDYVAPIPEEEWERDYPRVFSEKKLIDGKKNEYVALTARKYKDSGYGYSLYHPFIDEETGLPTEDGICFDFPDEEIVEVLELLSDAVQAVDDHRKKNGN